MSSAQRPVAVVTGASRGIGHHVADALEAEGYAVARGSTAVARVTDRDAVQRWVGDILDQHGRVDLLVNNAGVIDAEVPLLDSDPDQWAATLDVNVRGAYLMTWSVGRALRDRLGSTDGLRVVNLNSGSGLRAGEVATAYNLSKTALARLTGSTHLAGIACLDLMPGVVRTDMTESMRLHDSRTEWTDPAEVAALVVAFGGGGLDAWSGRFVRAGIDTPESLRAAAPSLGEGDRMLTLQPWGPEDPLR